MPPCPTLMESNLTLNICMGSTNVPDIEMYWLQSTKKLLKIVEFYNNQANILEAKSKLGLPDSQVGWHTWSEAVTAPAPSTIVLLNFTLESVHN